MQVMHDDDNNITICTALYQSSGFFIIMSPAEGLHFSALVFYSGSIFAVFKHVLRTFIPTNLISHACMRAAKRLLFSKHLIHENLSNGLFAKVYIPSKYTLSVR